MTQPDELAAWRLLTCNWIVLALMALTLVVALPLTGFSIKPATALWPFGITTVYVGFAYYNAWRPNRRDAKIVFILGSTGQVLLIGLLMVPLTYIAASANMPMQDVALMALDRALGFDWMAYFNFVYDRYPLLFASVLAYSMIGWPVFGIPIVLGIARHYRRIQEFTLAFAIALVLTTIISALVPAIGTYDLLQFMPDPKIFTPGAYLEQLRDLPMVRDGSLRQLEYTKFTGIITFPSFHSAAAVLYLWALWPVRWFRPIALGANIAMLLATPLGGGHYFVDVFAGIATAVIGIVAARTTANWLTRPTLLESACPRGVTVAAE